MEAISGIPVRDFWRLHHMSRAISRLAVVFAVVALASGCANTIRGVGADTANAVDATQRAGSDIASAAE
jgi:entericidin B